MSKYLIYPLLVVFLLGPFLSYVTDKSLGHDFLFSIAVITYFLFAAFILLAVGEGWTIVIPRYLWFFLAFTMFTVLSDIFIRGETVDLKYLYSNQYLPALLLAIMIENTFFTGEYVKLILDVSLLTLVVSVIVIILQQTGGQDFLVNPLFHQAYQMSPSVSSTTVSLPSIFSWLSPVSSGFTFVCLLSLVIDHYLRKGRRTISFYLLIAGFLYSFIAKDRWILINCSLLIFMFWIFDGKASKVSRFGFAALTGLFIMIFSLTVLSEFNVPVTKIIENRYLESRTGGFGTGSSSTRIVAISVFTQLFPRHPFLGVGEWEVGPGHINENPELAAALAGRSSQLHVGYLSLFYYYGIVGGILYLLFGYFLMSRLRTVAKYTGSWGAYFAILGLFIANLTLVFLTFYEVGLITALVYYKYMSQYLDEDLDEELSVG